MGLLARRKWYGQRRRIATATKSFWIDPSAAEIQAFAGRKLPDRRTPIHADLGGPDWPAGRRLFGTIPASHRRPSLPGDRERLGDYFLFCQIAVLAENRDPDRGRPFGRPHSMVGQPLDQSPSSAEYDRLHGSDRGRQRLHLGAG